MPGPTDPIVLIAQDKAGVPFAVGPIYTTPAIAEARALIEARGGEGTYALPLLTWINYRNGASR